MKLLKRLMEFVTHRAFMVAFMIFLELIFLIALIWSFNSQNFISFYLVSYILGIFMSIFIINNNTNPGYKIAWIMIILILPAAGTIIYMLFGGNQLSKREKKKLKDIYYHQKRNIEDTSEELQNLKNQNEDAYLQAKYISKFSLSPLYKNTTCEYFKSGRDYYTKLLEELKNAKKYIFLEYFIIEEGIMWNSILDILKQKVKENVEVRVMYDDLGCILTLPDKYYNTLKSYGIKACTFNKFVPILRSKFNNRDHRKIAIIDGYIGFTGGINLADEYIGEKEKYGYWKDNGVMIKGASVWNMAIMFMTLWDFVNEENYSYKTYKPEEINTIKSDSYIMPYCDNPWDNEATGETIYFNLINKAKKYIYITTPYLILDNEMLTSLCTASKNGVDVRIITPGIPDKKIINEVTKAYYNQLLKNGVKIYEYTPGFIHTKTFIVDDKYATVGSVNLDYRSLFLNFENGVWIYNDKVINDILKDYLETLEKSEEIYLNKEKLSKLQNLKRQILMAFAPLM